MLNMEQLLPLVNKTHYVWWKDGEPTSAKPAPFYCASTVNLEYIKIHGCNCAGLLNLLAHVKGSPVPGVKSNIFYAGGTYVWHSYLESIGALQPIDISKTYPKGSLLLRRYEDPENQGHVALIYEDATCSQSTFLEQKLLHCYPDKGISIDDQARSSHNWHTDGYYEYCVPGWFYRTLAEPNF